MNPTSSLDQAAFFTAIANPVRLEVIKILRERGEGISKDLREILEARLDRPVSQSLLSQQMRSLREVGIVSSERQQQNIIFRINKGMAAQFQEYLADMNEAFESVH